MKGLEFLKPVSFVYFLFLSSVDRPSSVASCQGVLPAYSQEDYNRRFGPIPEANAEIRKWPGQVNQLDPGSIRNSTVKLEDPTCNKRFNLRGTPFPSVLVRNKKQSIGTSHTISPSWLNNLLKKENKE